MIKQLFFLLSIFSIPALHASSATPDAADKKPSAANIKELAEGGKKITVIDFSWKIEERATQYVRLTQVANKNTTEFIAETVIYDKNQEQDPHVNIVFYAKTDEARTRLFSLLRTLQEKFDQNGRKELDLKLMPGCASGIMQDLIWPQAKPIPESIK